jgi:hypothetical protein
MVIPMTVGVLRGVLKKLVEWRSPHSPKAH